MCFTITQNCFSDIITAGTLDLHILHLFSIQFTLISYSSIINWLAHVWSDYMDPFLSLFSFDAVYSAGELRHLNTLILNRERLNEGRWSKISDRIPSFLSVSVFIIKSLWIFHSQSLPVSLPWTLSESITELLF